MYVIALIVHICCSGLKRGAGFSSQAKHWHLVHLCMFEAMDSSGSALHYSRSIHRQVARVQSMPGGWKSGTGGEGILLSR